MYTERFSLSADPNSGREVPILELTNVIVVVKCKRDCIDIGVKQCVAYVRAASDMTPENQFAFEFCSDGVYYSLVSYDRVNVKFKLSEPQKN